VHRRVEDLLGLTDVGLTPPRLQAIVARLSGFWTAAEQRLDEWAAEWPEHSDALHWPLRRRSRLFADDLVRLGAASGPRARPGLPAVPGTAEALGLLYVLEGSSLGGQIINRVLAARDAADPLAGFQLSGLAPYGDATGAMWHEFRGFVAGWVDAGGSAPAMVEAAVGTFAELESWCSCLQVDT
jgi:heme oxygenase